MNRLIVNWCFFCISVSILIKNVLCEDLMTYETDDLVEKPSTWFQSAQDMLSSPAGHVVMYMARELIKRSTGSSQVLSLNLTNLLIIALLKLLIFAAGLLGAGHWSHYGGYGYARSMDTHESSFGLVPGEDSLITAFFAAQSSGSDNCLYAAACDNPTIAYEYAKTAKALINGIRAFDEHFSYKPRYNELINVVEKGVYDGYNGIMCNKTAVCNEIL